MVVKANNDGKPSDDLNSPEYAAAPKDQQVSWNTKTTPVPFGYQVNRYGSFPVQTDKPRQVPYNEAMNYLNEIRGKGGDEYKKFLGQLQRYNNSESTSASGVENMWKNVLDDAEASGVNAMDLLKRGTKIDEEGKGGGRGGYKGPTATTTLMNERDVRATADAVAATVIGRGITDEEFNKILKQVRTAERAEPTVTTPGVGTSVTQSGLSTQGRQDIIREALMKGPEAEDYGKATKMMDLFYKTLEARPEGG